MRANRRVYLMIDLSSSSSGSKVDPDYIAGEAWIFQITYMPSYTCAYKPNYGIFCPRLSYQNCGQLLQNRGTLSIGFSVLAGYRARLVI